MNVRNKIISVVMSFVIIIGACSSSFADDKKYIDSRIQPMILDGCTISVPMLATVSALAVGTGVVLRDSDDIYDIGRLFYDYVQNSKELTWDFVNATFHSSVALVNGFVNVKKDFLDITKGFFDNVFNFADENNLDSIKFNSYNLVERPGYFHLSLNDVNAGNDFIEQVGNVYFRCTYTGTQTKYVSKYKVEVSLNGVDYVLVSESMSLGRTEKDVCLSALGNMLCLSSVSSAVNNSGSLSSYNLDTLLKIVSSVGALPYAPGSYNWDNVKDKYNEEKDSLPVSIPNNLGDLLGKNPSDVLDSPGSLSGNPSLPGVNNPSIDIGAGTFPGVSDTPINPPADTPFASIQEFIVGLVVPSDTFWTDLFTGFRDNLQSNFPMLDMSAFDSLLVDGKPFPNMFAFGGKIVDGDTINSIVGWLRPIIAGFVMLLLLFFNYRKLHKIIRNSDPYGSVAEKGCTANVN